MSSLRTRVQLVGITFLLCTGQIVPPEPLGEQFRDDLELAEDSFNDTDRKCPIPMVIVGPEHPRDAQGNYVAGWVIIGFAILETGITGYPYVYQSQPEGLFDEVAIQAVASWKFQPAMERGTPATYWNWAERIVFGDDLSLGASVESEILGCQNCECTPWGPVQAGR